MAEDSEDVDWVSSEKEKQDDSEEKHVRWRGGYPDTERRFEYIIVLELARQNFTKQIFFNKHVDCSRTSSIWGADP